MTDRTRFRDLTANLVGSYYNHTLGIEDVNFASVGRKEWCVDTVGRRKFENPFDLTRTVVSVPTLNGCFPDEISPTKQFVDYPITRQVGAPSPDNPEFPSWDLVAIAHRVAATTNPSTPSTGVAQPFVELKDFASLPGNLQATMKKFLSLQRAHKGSSRASLRAFKVYLLETGQKRLEKRVDKAILKDVTSKHLLYEFVAKPMVADFRKLLDVQKQVDHNLRVLRHLQSGRALRRRALLGIDVITDPDVEVFLQSEGAVIKAICSTSYKLEQWATIRWSLIPSQLPDSSAALRKKARDVALGLTSYEGLRSGFALLPWTWLTNWFVDVGSVLDKFNNSIPARIEDINYMRRTTSRRSYELIEIPDWVKISHLPSESEVHKRRIPIPAFVASLPYVPGRAVLTPRQWLILGSLVTQRVT